LALAALRHYQVPLAVAVLVVVVLLVFMLHLPELIFLLPEVIPLA
jgi:hypothetical protein